jgi:hypothetical protein
VTHSREELPSIVGSVLPIVLSVPLRAIRLIPANVDIAIGKDLQPLLVLLPFVIQGADEDISDIVLYDAKA